MVPAAAAGYGLPGASQSFPADMVTVVEIQGGGTVTLSSLSVTAAQNTHYSFPPGTEQDRKFKSLAFRFNLADRSIVYTGDTGPSADVERLAKGADLLVSEMIDVDATVLNVKMNMPAMSPAALGGLVQHLSRHHLTPAQVGALASRAGVKAVVVTHLVAPGASATTLQGYVDAIREVFSGRVTIASDLQRF